MALRAAGWPVTGWGPRPQTLQLALELGAIDRVASSPGAAVAQAELVIASGPIRTLPMLFRSVAAAAAPGTIVTDVASVKGEVMAWARDTLPPYLEFVGGHPMAGREQTGVRSASAELFRGCTYCLVPTSGRSLEAGETLAAAVGAQALVVEAEAHDLAVAATSHLPFVVSTALVGAVQGDLAGLAGTVGSSGFRDTTRIAAGSPEMHADICHYNQPAITQWIERFQRQLENLKAQLSQDSIQQTFSDAREARLAWAERKASEKGANP
ncbi:MAG: prephenate dehydrogenase/arogenate dehydrogenase family protein [Chloroflexota bacterium]|nr:prephenate dehydrogenase/arogenate dehydrogenase family protein [Chloroflexota bacterium]